MTYDETRPPPARVAASPPAGVPVRALAFFAHEMGNPLGAILGFAQLMAADAAHPLAGEQARRLELLTASGLQLRALLDDLVDFGALDSGQLRLALQPVDVGEHLRHALARVAPQALHAGVALRLEAPSPARLQADPARLQQCLANLLSNAIKYNRVGGNVWVDIGAAAGRVRIAVHDDGLGMDPAQMARMFTPFDRLGRESCDVPGSGLGLLITRELLRAMGGTLDVASRPGNGSCFTIVLPAAYPSPWPPEGCQ